LGHLGCGPKEHELVVGVEEHWWERSWGWGEGGGDVFQTVVVLFLLLWWVNTIQRVNIIRQFESVRPAAHSGQA
jgi:hypothetical protein